MKLNMGKNKPAGGIHSPSDQTAIKTDAPAKPAGLQLGKPKAQEPTKSLKEQLASASAAKMEAPKSALANLLANKPADVSAAQTPAKPAPNKIQLASESEKYVLDASATEQLSQTVLDDFAAKMQHLIYAMDTQELPTALHSVLSFAQENPHLRDILRADDIRLVVRGARKSYGMTVVAKTTNKTRTTKQSALTKDIMADLADVSFSV